VAITLAEPREHRMLRNIEQLTRQKIAVERVPTIVDLRARRLELTRAALREALLAGELDDYRVVVESLSEEFDPMDVATAAVKLVHQSSGDGTAEAEEIPSVAVPDDRPSRDRGARRDRFSERGERAARRGDGERPPRPRRGAGRHDTDVTRLYIGLGRKAGIRPGDLVGAIANEAGIDARSIGAIDIADRFSLVEVPGDSADAIIDALRGTTIRGKKVMARRDRDAE
jgi:ATP-dependent RNA helicase DeaD